MLESRHVRKAAQRRVWLATAFLMTSVGATETSADFDDQIQPFLEKHCVTCHGEKKQKAEFALHDINGDISKGKDAVRWEKTLEMLSLAGIPSDDFGDPDLGLSESIDQRGPLSEFMA